MMRKRDGFRREIRESAKVGINSQDSELMTKTGRVERG